MSRRMGLLGGGKVEHDWLTYVDVVYVDKTNVNDYYTG